MLIIATIIGTLLCPIFTLGLVCAHFEHGILGLFICLYSLSKW